MEYSGRWGYLSARWKFKTTTDLQAMYFILLDILKVYAFGSNKDIKGFLYNKGFENLILSASEKCDFTCVNNMIKKVEGFKAGVLNPASIHDDLMIEGVLTDWHFVLAKKEELCGR